MYLCIWQPQVFLMKEPKSLTTKLVVLKLFGFRIPLLLKIKSFYLYGLYLSMFTVLEIKTVFKGTY